MPVTNKLYLEHQLSDLTSRIDKATSLIAHVRKVFSACKIVLSETETAEFISALTKLFEQINQCERDDTK